MATSKRFRPLIESICSHERCVDAPCSIPCAHCPMTFCLRHLVEHQTAIDNENKRVLSSIDSCRRHLETLEFQDNRLELFDQLNQWVKATQETAETMKNEIGRRYEECLEEFQKTKDTVFNEEDEDGEEEEQTRNMKEVLTGLEWSVQTLESARLHLVISPPKPFIRLIKPKFDAPLSTSSCSTQRPSLDRLFSSSDVVFSFDCNPTDMTHFATSPDLLILYQSSRSVFQFFSLTGEHLSDMNFDHIHYGDLQQLTWSASLNAFLLATSKQLLKLNCSAKRLTRYVDIGFGFFKDVCTSEESILLVHHLGTSLGDVIEHYSHHELVQRCWKADLYPDEKQMKDTMEIFRIRMSAHLVAIDALFTDKILVCDTAQAMACLFRIGTKNCSILAMSPIYNTEQWLVFVTDAHDESAQQRVLVIDAQQPDDDQKMHELKVNGLAPTNLVFFGPNHFILTRTDPQDEENIFLQCRKMRTVL